MCILDRKDTLPHSCMITVKRKSVTFRLIHNYYCQYMRKPHTPSKCFESKYSTLNLADYIHNIDSVTFQCAACTIIYNIT